MLDTILAATEVAPDLQHSLYELYTRNGDDHGLAGMCAIPNLLPELDTKLAKCNQVTVRRAWVLRPGRDLETVKAMLVREKRVAMLVELAGFELPDELYRQILAANTSPKVAMALALNTKVPDAIRTEAIAAASGHAKLSAEQLRQIVELTVSLGIEAVLLEHAVNLKLLERAVITDDATPAGVANLTTRLTAHADEIGAEVRVSRWVPYQTRDRLDLWLHVAGLAIAADWCNDTLLKAVTELSGTLEAVCAASVGTSRFESFKRQLEAREQSQDGTIEGWLRSAAVLRSEDEVQALVAAMSAVPDTRRIPIIRELMANPRLGVPSQVLAFRAVSSATARRQLFKGIAAPRLTTQAQAALVLGGYLDPRSEAVAGLVVEHLDEVPYGAASVVVTLLQSGHLTDEMLLALPCETVHRITAGATTTVVSVAIRRRIGDVLAAQLAGQPATVLEQFRQLAPSFSASIAALIATCKAVEA